MGVWEKVKKIFTTDPDGPYTAYKDLQKIGNLFDKKDFESALEKSTEYSAAKSTAEIFLRILQCPECKGCQSK